MSRLFDALKGASNFRQGNEGKAGEGVWAALGINEADLAPVLNDADVSRQNAPSAVLPEKLGVVFQEDEVPRDFDQFEDSDATPTTVSVDQRARLIQNAVDPVVAEYYRRLRTKVMQQQAESNFRSLVVTSANPQEGKTVTVLNLGLSFSMLPSFKVLVVDGDLRRGTLGNWLGVDHDHPGLSNLIDGSAQLENVLFKSDKIPMHFVVRGNSQVPDLHTSQLQSHFQRMTEQYDLVLVDTPPVNLIADVQLLAASCDAVLLVARAFSTTRKALEKAVQELHRFRVIGTVLNAGTAQRYRYRGDYY